MGNKMLKVHRILFRSICLLDGERAKLNFIVVPRNWKERVMKPLFNFQERTRRKNKFYDPSFNFSDKKATSGSKAKKQNHDGLRLPEFACALSQYSLLFKEEFVTGVIWQGRVEYCSFYSSELLFTESKTPLAHYLV
jgi:hypothetical protein